jgi:hypothetical protein
MKKEYVVYHSEIREGENGRTKDYNREFVFGNRELAEHKAKSLAVLSAEESGKKDAMTREVLREWTVTLVERTTSEKTLETLADFTTSSELPDEEGA